MSFKTKGFSLELPTNGGVSIVLCAASRSGKSSIMKYIYAENFKKCITVMFTMNPHADIYKDMSDKIMVSDSFHPEIIHDMAEINKLTDNNQNFLVISDDYVDNRIKTHPEITRLLSIHRNCGISSIFSFQGRVLLSSTGRNQANYIIIGKQNTPLEYTNVIKEFLSGWLPMGMSMAEMVRFVQEATKDFQFFMIDNIKNECYLTKLSARQAGV